jgi:hypothetical protein
MTQEELMKVYITENNYFDLYITNKRSSQLSKLPIFSKWRVNLIMNYMPLSCNWLQDVIACNTVLHIRLMITEEVIKSTKFQKLGCLAARHRILHVHLYCL